MDASGFGVPSSEGKGGVLAVLYYSSSSTPGRLSKLCYALLQEPLYVSKKIAKMGLPVSCRDFFVNKYLNVFSHNKIIK